MATSDDQLKLAAALEGVVAGNARVGVQKSAVLIGLRRFINLVPGTNVEINVTDDPTNEKVDVEIVAEAGAVGTTTSTAVTAPGSATGYTPAASTVQGHLEGIGTALGLKQVGHAILTALAGLTGAADKLPYFTGASAMAVATFTAFGRTMAALADAAAGRTALELAALAQKATIDAAALIDNGVVTLAKIVDATATDKLLGRSTAGSGDWEEIDCTAAGRALLDDADASAQRVTLGREKEDITWHIESPTAKTYTLIKKARYACTIDGLVHQTASGSITGKIQIDGVDVTGLTALTFDSSETETAASALRSVAVGQDVTLVCSSASSPADLIITLYTTV